jgi:hypothetical protein
VRPRRDRQALFADALKLRLRHPDWSANRICRELRVRGADGQWAVREANALLAAIRGIERRRYGGGR